jgi:hypothetical protein
VLIRQRQPHEIDRQLNVIACEVNLMDRSRCLVAILNDAGRSIDCDVRFLTSGA